MIYQGEYTREISFPIGGIGTGSFGIAGNGSFIDWEILNRPNKGSCWEMSHIAVKAADSKGRVVAKVLQGDLNAGLMGTYQKENYRGYGYGPDTGTMCGISHFRSCVFEGEFPIARLIFSDEEFPGKVVLTVFNPFIPLDSFHSSIPAGYFQLEFQNPGEEEIEYSAVFSMRNPFERSRNEIVVKDDFSLLHLTTELDRENTAYGDLSILTDAQDTEIQQYWYRGIWKDNLDVFIRELTEKERLSNRIYDTGGRGDVGSVAAHIRIPAGENGRLRFVLAWNSPNQWNYWNPKYGEKTWKNYYATVFDSSLDSAVYSMKHFDSLLERTLLFKDTLFDSSIDRQVTEAVSATLSVLKSPTVLRLEDGSFYGWEGVHEMAGSCEGTCQHVWNYAYALCFLFPDLERSIRDNEYGYCTRDTGETDFRMSLPRGSGRVMDRACLDGQMGTIIKTYREWKLSGDSEWLAGHWPTVKKVLSYAWSEENQDRWDYDRDGVLEGRQHHTLDMELFGPSAWLQGFYLGALKAAAEMAEYLEDIECVKECEALFEKGYQWTKENLFNGEYFIQKIDLKDKGVIDRFEGTGQYWYEETEEIKYQIGEGCEIDQLCGQWHANICGLGRLFDAQQTKTALESLYRNNFKSSMRSINNTWRIFCLNDESGAVMCDFPREKPALPIPYHAECMTGFEYALAGLMISEGMEREGLAIVKGIRDRYDGKKRNPWNEIECGNNYARAMASFALLPLYSGLQFDLPRKTIGFRPLTQGDFKCLFSVGTAWGSLERTGEGVRVSIMEGELLLERFVSPAEAGELWIDGKKTEFVCENCVLSFESVAVRGEIVIR